MKRTIFIALAALLALTYWFIAPVYQFYAHRGIAPLPPFGWVDNATDAPMTQAVSDPAFAEAGSLALEEMAAHRASANLPSLSAAVAVGDQLVWAGAVGYADLESATPATPDTLFRIGSTSKALTATAMARLVDRGEFDLDTTLSQYLPDIPNPAWSPITPRQLAAHSAGIPHYGENTDVAGLYRSVAMRAHYADVRDALTIFDGSELLHEPGSAFHYSSLGTVLLGATLSDASGLTYRELVRREVIDPAGMASTYADSDRDDRAVREATFYYTDGKRFRPWREVDLSHRLPGGGFISSPSDLVRMGAMVLDSGYLSQEVREQFWTPQRLDDGSVNEQHYALGWRWREWEIDGVGVARNANHGGVSRGSQCWLLVYPDYRMSLAFCTNTKTAEFQDFGRFHEPFFRAFATPAARRSGIAGAALTRRDSGTDADLDSQVSD